MLNLVIIFLKSSNFFKIQKKCCIVDFGDDASDCRNKRRTLVSRVAGALGAPTHDNGKGHLSIAMLSFPKNLRVKNTR